MEPKTLVFKEISTAILVQKPLLILIMSSDFRTRTIANNGYQ
jgi:hypothetical protein